MSRLLIVASLLTAAPAVADPPPKPALRLPAARIPATGCVNEGDPAIANAHDAAGAWNVVVLAQALAKLGIERVELAENRITLGSGMDPDQPGVTGPVSGDMVVGPTVWTGQANQPSPMTFGQQGNKVFALELSGRPSTRTTVHVCGAAPPRCPDYGSPCPACHATVQMLYGPLPANTTYVTTPKRVNYPTHVVTLQYAAKAVAKPCSPPPKSAPPKGGL